MNTALHQTDISFPGATVAICGIDGEEHTQVVKDVTCSACKDINAGVLNLDVKDWDKFWLSLSDPEKVLVYEFSFARKGIDTQIACQKDMVSDSQRMFRRMEDTRRKINKAYESYVKSINKDSL